MMRWLKEKKRGEKKSGGGQHDDPYKEEEDDYGFEKEKFPNKSPVAKRQLPPTPAAPEEKSTHIYEEIPDLHVSCTPEHERTSLLKNNNNKKQGKSNAKTTPSASGNAKSNPRTTNPGSRSEGPPSLDDSISPYMVVSVDEEVRQTPPHFNRNGTPEVHCDLIVKDTHCEIFLTRKPKVGAFRLDSTALTGNEGGAACASSGHIRNNTHFCSWNRRASVDVQAGGGEGKGASAFSWSSSAFSSASTSKVNSMGTTSSSMSLSTLQEHQHRHHGRGGQQQILLPSSSVTEGDSGSNGSSAKGIMTYSTASNFIPRSTKLVFKPLTPLDPEMFDDPDQDIALRAAEMACNSVQNTAALPHPAADDDSESIEYASVQGQTKAESGSSSPVVYSAIQDQDARHGHCEPSSPPPTQQEIRQCQALSISDSPFRSALIRPYSPSSSSSGTYASVSFPVEPRLYNTIQNLDNIMSEAPPTGPHALSPSSYPAVCQDGGETTLYPGVGVGGGELCNEGVASRSCFTNYSSGDFITEPKFTGGRPPRTDSSQPHQHQRPNFLIQYSEGKNTVDGPGPANRVASSDGAIYSGIGNPCDLNTTDITYSCIDPKEDAMATHTTTSLLQNKMDGGLVLDFCTCQDYHQYSSCGCATDLKAADDDDNASVATTTNEIKGSCSGCGRLIRQITYSESYSDETYEHAYSSRLLLRKGRRFSSPDITLSEISNSESQDLRFRQGSPFSTMSRDDMMFSRSQACDVQSTFYRPDGDFDSSSADHPVVLNGREQRPVDFSNTTKDSVAHHHLTHRKSICAFGTTTSNDPGIISSKPDPPAVSGSGKTYMKRTSLPTSCTSSTSSPLMIPSDLGHAKATAAAVAQLQPTKSSSSTFSGLFSKFSKSKIKSGGKPEHESLQHGQQTGAKGGAQEQQNVDAPVKLPTSSFTVNPSPEKNVLKLSKIFQRLSVKDGGCESQTQSHNHHITDSSENKGKAGALRGDLESFTQKLPTDTSQDLHLPPPDESTDVVVSKRPSHDPDSSVLEITNASKTYSNKNNDNNSTTINKIYNSNNKSNKGSGSSNNKNNNSKFTSIGDMSKKSGGGSTCVESTHEARPTLSLQTQSSGDTKTKQSVNFDVEQALSENGAKAKSANKTDSGDTCYEYDISTSSESEHTSYDYFLSKVKKSLNLEKEVQHIADMNALRKRLLCKMCKKGGSSAPDQSCEMCGVDGACSHVPSLKCSDWRKFFGELVVDQRAAILDCLTDFAHSPYTVKGDGLVDNGGHCRECGGEIMTSDSESLTTVYSLLSQQFRMTSPGAQTPSCDSDEGTMADNSCESGDDEKKRNGCGDRDGDGDSSGFDDYDDDAAGEQLKLYGGGVGADQRQQHVRSSGKTKKREKAAAKDKREKKSHSHYSLLERPSRRKSRSSLSSLPQDDSQCHHGNSENATGLSMDNLVSPQSLSSPHKHSRRSCGGGGGGGGGNKHQHHHCSNGQCYNTKALTVANSSSVDNIVMTSKTASLKDTGSDTNRDARAKTSLLATDRAIQDIYAPLPSKALSWLTTRHTAPRNNPCACSSRIPSSASLGSLSKSSTEPEVHQEKEKEDPGVKETVMQHPENLPQDASNVTKVNGELTSSNVQSTNGPKSTAVSEEAIIISFQDNSRAKKTPPDLCSTSVGTKKQSNMPAVGEVLHGSTTSDQKIISPGLTLNNRRRSRQLPLAALDLLPETAFGSDVIPDEDMMNQKEGGTPSMSKKSEKTLPSSSGSKPPKPRLVERMTRLFENNNNGGGIVKQSKDSKAKSPKVKPASESQKGRVHGVDEKKAPGKLIGEPNDNGFNNKCHHLASANWEGQTTGGLQQPSPATPLRHSRSESKSGVESSPTPKARTALQENRLQDQVQVQEAPIGGDSMTKADRPLSSANKDTTTSAQKDSNVKSPSPTKRGGSIGANDTKISSNRELMARKLPTAPPSPTFSTSSSSSSSSSSSLSRRRASSQAKQKRLLRKSHLNKKAKSKTAATDRKKKKKSRKEGEKEEKTYYCFSSDMSDIDVVEVEDWSVYSCSSQRSVSESETRRRRSHSNGRGGGNSHGGKDVLLHRSGKEEQHKTSRRERSVSRRRDSLASESGGKSKRRQSSTSSRRDIRNEGQREREKKKREGEEEAGEDVQEIYAMPPNSSEVCEVKTHWEDASASPTASPELRKLRKKSKRTDIYKTKKSNNRLLSDLIIRNYDRQVFGNV